MSRRLGEQSNFEWLKAVVDGPPTTDCIDWPFCIVPPGYGFMRVKNKGIGAHRMACLLAHGPAPKGRPQAAHFYCARPQCVNPAHLRWSSARENCADKLVVGNARFLSLVELREIRAALIDRRHGTVTNLARQYGVTRKTIYRVADRETWQWVDELKESA